MTRLFRNLRSGFALAFLFCCVRSTHVLTDGLLDNRQRHDDDRRQHVAESQRHEEVVEHILELSLVADGQTDQHIATDRHEDYEKESKRRPVVCARRQKSRIGAVPSRRRRREIEIAHRRRRRRRRRRGMLYSAAIEGGVPRPPRGVAELRAVSHWG